jgi:uncharacterized damage-inducible protein DinB
MTNKEFFIQTWQSEMGSTLNAIKGLPSDMTKLNYQPDAKAKTASELISHFLGHAEVMNNAADTFIAEEKSATKLFNSKEDSAAYFEKNAAAVIEKLKSIDDTTWDEKPISFRFDGHELFAYPMSNTFWMLMFDIIHHRGQLSTYYRHMGVRNPQIYGPTAEDMEEMAAGKN